MTDSELAGRLRELAKALENDLGRHWPTCAELEEAARVLWNSVGCVCINFEARRYYAGDVVQLSARVWDGHRHFEASTLREAVKLALAAQVRRADGPEVKTAGNGVPPAVVAVND